MIPITGHEHNYGPFGACYCGAVKCRWQGYTLAGGWILRDSIYINELADRVECKEPSDDDDNLCKFHRAAEILLNEKMRAVRVSEDDVKAYVERRS